MTSPDVHLRPFAEADLVLLDRFATEPDFGRPFEWRGFRSSAADRRRWHEDGLLGRSPYHLVVALGDGTHDGSTVGWVDWRDDGRAGTGVLEIGILLVPERRGQGIGTAAQSQLVD
jgi:RimJ/RimL family protein N-acetyltransferase